MTHIVLPELGEGISSAILAAWHVREGQEVDEETEVAEVVTDKAVFQVPSGHRGVVTRLLAAPRDEVRVGAPLAEVAPI